MAVVVVVVAVVMVVVVMVLVVVVVVVVVASLDVAPCNVWRSRAPRQAPCRMRMGHRYSWVDFSQNSISHCAT